MPLEILELKQKNVNLFNTGRNFDALSLRTHSNAMMKTADATYPMGQYSVCYVPAGLSYHRTASYDELIAINFTLANYVGHEIAHFIPQEPETFVMLFQEMLRLWKEKAPDYQYRCTALLYEVLALCHKQNAKPLPRPSKIQVAVAYMQQNFTKSDLSIRKIAQKAYISEVYFRKLFKAEFGISPQKYLINLRIQNATNLMETGYYSLKEVAFLSGYRDYKYFSVEFKKITGFSPSEYLQINTAI